jgi:NhaA family Na+:H+ antiporter
MKLTKLFRDFTDNEKASGVVLVICTIISLLLANSAIGDSYVHFWHTPFFNESVEYWINDGLMAIFFLMVGLELEREIYKGELSNLKTALLPVFAALGGMIVPAGIHFMFNGGTEFSSGAGIPMATDIAFAIGVLSLLGNRVPVALKVFLTALAVIDDLGAILTIAIFYSSGLSWMYLGGALGLFAVMLVMNRMKVYVLWPYLILGVAMWYLMLHSGIHATITGVLLAFAIPFQKGEENSISYKLQHFLHKPVSFIILPIFALANTCIVIESGWVEGLMTTNSYGIFTGLVLGKPIGITLFTCLAVWFGISKMPSGVKVKEIIGVGFLGGIGFTMSIFVTLLAFDDPYIISESKITILLSSLTAAIIGLIWLSFVLKSKLKEI